MESSKVKNIVLILLIITNVLLLGLVVVQRVDSRRQQQKALADVTELLAQRGIALKTALPQGDFPPSLALKQDPAAQEGEFDLLLGEGTTLTQRGLVWTYNGPLGRAEVRENGAFTVELTEGAYPLEPGEDLAKHARDVLSKRLDFSGRDVSVQGDSVTLTQSLKGAPVFSCTVTLSYQNGSLATIVGTRLPGEPVADAKGGQALSVPTLLVRFRAGIIDSGDAVTAITAATQGYTLSANAAGSYHLIPVLRLETDTNPYLINALTGELTRG